LIKQIKCTFQQEFEMLDDGKFDYTLSNAIIHNQQEGWTNLHLEIFDFPSFILLSLMFQNCSFVFQALFGISYMLHGLFFFLVC
jgi:hypothetical protein